MDIFENGELNVMRLPRGEKLTDAEASLAHQGRLAVAHHLKKLHQNEGDETALRAALRLSHHAMLMVMRFSGRDAEKAERYTDTGASPTPSGVARWHVQAEAQGYAVGIAEFLYAKRLSGSA